MFSQCFFSELELVVTFCLHHLQKTSHEKKKELISLTLFLPMVIFKVKFGH